MEAYRTAFLRTGTRVGLLLLIAATAQAVPITINLASGTVGDLGTAMLTTPEGLVVDGFYHDGTSWQAAHLFRRNDSDDHGLGICNPMETCTSTTSEGDINELDNAGEDELIRLTLPDGYEWVSVRLSSVDDNDGNSIERGELYADNDGIPGNGLGSVIWQFAGGGMNPVEPAFFLLPANQSSPYLFFRPFDWKNGSNDNNDFLIWKVTIQRRVPEPGSLAFLAVGLLGLTALGRRRRTS